MIYLVQFLTIAAGCILALVFGALSSFTFEELGFRWGKTGKWLLGVLMIEGVALLKGINFSLKPKELVWLGLFMLVVGIFEEFIYCSLVLNYLKKYRGKKQF